MKKTAILTLIALAFSSNLMAASIENIQAERAKAYNDYSNALKKKPKISRKDARSLTRKMLDPHSEEMNSALIKVQTEKVRTEKVQAEAHSGRPSRKRLSVESHEITQPIDGSQVPQELQYSGKQK